MAGFKCGKCGHKVELEPQLADPSATTYDLILGAATTPRPAPTEPAYPTSREKHLHDALAESTMTVVGNSPSKRKDITPSTTKLDMKSSDSFVVVPGDNPKLYEKIERQQRLFELLSKNSDIDHPVCSGCADQLILAMNKNMAELERDRNAYVSYLNKIKGEMPTEEDHAKAKAELEELQKQEKIALDELRQVENERAEVLAELAQLEKENAVLDEEELKFWEERNQFAAEIDAYQLERDSIELRLNHDSKLLERLQKTNVYDDTFHIGHDGTFGTINGLRLGRLPGHPVPWDEINAALGLTILLLQTMAEALQFVFRGYKLVPMGSTSRIEQIESVDGHTTKVKVLELVGSGSSFRQSRRTDFEKGLVAFLECLQQLGDFAESSDKKVVMPNKIKKDTIGDACIKIEFNNEENWTRALKYCLTNCKWILAFVSRKKRKTSV